MRLTSIGFAAGLSLSWIASSPGSAAAQQAPPAAEEDPPFELHWAGYIQAQYEVHQDSRNEVDAGAPLNLDRFSVRRGRLKLEVDALDAAKFMIQIDATSTAVSLRDAVASVFEPWTGLRLELAGGLFKNPFGFEVLQSSRDRIFPERSLLGRTLYPGERDVGVRLSLKHELLRVALALVNGNPIGERAFPGRDPNAHKDLVGRVGVATSIVDAGVSGHLGTEFVAGTPASPAVTSWLDEDEDAEVDADEVETTAAVDAVPSENVNRWRIGADAVLHVDLPRVGRLEVLAEIAFAHRAEGDQAAEQNLLVGYLGAIQRWKWLGLGVRVDLLDRDLDAEDDRVIVIEPVLFAEPTEPIRFSLAWDFVLEEGTSVDNDVLTARLQVGF